MAAMQNTGKYVFTKGLKELRFHLCQQSEGSSALRYAMRLSTQRTLSGLDHRLRLALDRVAGWLTGWIRSFLTRAYPTMKRNNAYTPILIREALGVEPKVWARYGDYLCPSGLKGATDIWQSTEGRR